MTRKQHVLRILHLNILVSLLAFLPLAACQEDSGEVPVTDPNLKVCSFNIRFDNPDDGLNAWENRRQSVVSFLGIDDADIIGMQEVLAHQLSYIEMRMEDYSRIGVGRDDGVAAGEFTPILYRTERFALLDSGTFWLSETPETPSLGWDALIRRICTWAYLEDRNSGEVVHVYNTHFSHVGPEARRESAALIMDRIEENSQGVAVVLTGDFNAEPGSDPIDEITGRGLEDSYQSGLVLGPVGTYNGFRLLGPHDRRIDFVLTRGFRSLHYVSNSIVVNNNYISDHFPVTVLLEYTP